MVCIHLGNLYEVLKVYTFYKASWLSWLERRPVTAEVGGSSPPGVVCGILAQLGEHLPYKQRVTGSSPVGPIFKVKTQNEFCVVRRCGSIHDD